MARITHVVKNLIRLRGASLLFICIVVGHTALAEPIITEQRGDLKQILLGYLEVPQDKDEMKMLIHQHVEQIGKDPELAVAAIIVAREYNDFDLALVVADQALASGIKSPRLYFELGIVFLLQQKCHEASLIFRALITADHANNTYGMGVADEWIREESRQALQLCKAPLVWIYDYDFTLSYDDNLAGVAPRQRIHPEPASQLGQSLGLLRKIFPDLPNEVTLGEKPVKGIVGTFSQYLDQYHHIDGAQYGIHLQADTRLSQPTGYEQIGLNVGLSRGYTIEDLTVSNVLSVFLRRHKRGKHRGDFKEEGLRLHNSISLRGQYSPSLNVMIEQNTTQSIFQRTNQLFDISARLRHLPSDESHLNWFAEIGTKETHADDTYYSSSTRYYSIGFDRLKLNDFSAISFSIRHERLKPEWPRPWLENIHTTKIQQFTLVYHGLYKTRSFDLIAGYAYSYSYNQTENFDRFSLSLRFK